MLQPRIGKVAEDRRLRGILHGERVMRAPPGICLADVTPGAARGTDKARRLIRARAEHRQQNEDGAHHGPPHEGHAATSKTPDARSASPDDSWNWWRTRRRSLTRIADAHHPADPFSGMVSIRGRTARSRDLNIRVSRATVWHAACASFYSTRAFTIQKLASRRLPHYVIF